MREANVWERRDSCSLLGYPYQTQKKQDACAVVMRASAPWSAHRASIAAGVKLIFRVPVQNGNRELRRRVLLKLLVNRLGEAGQTAFKVCPFLSVRFALCRPQKELNLRPREVGSCEQGAEKTIAEIAEARTRCRLDGQACLDDRGQLNVWKRSCYRAAAFDPSAPAVVILPSVEARIDPSVPIATMGADRVRAARHQLVKHDTNSKNVCLLAEHRRDPLLGSHIGSRSAKLRNLGC